MRKRITALVLCLGISFVGVGAVGALPQVAASGLALPALPTRFYGSITLNGGNAPANGLLTALIGQEIYATVAITLSQGRASYVIDVPGDDPTTAQLDGGREGDQVHFSLRGYSTVQQAVWREGQATALDLTFTPNLSVSPTPPSPHPVSIPEPATWLLLSAGLAALATIRVQRRRQ